MDNHFLQKVKLDAYDGPLDLLLTLIKKNKINIYYIPVAEITDQYMEAIGLDENGVAPFTGSVNLDLDAGGDFIIMAAQLIYIKSVTLLPKYGYEKNGEDDAEAADPRTELTNMLLEYRKVKETADFLNNRPILGRDVFEIKAFKNDEAVVEKNFKLKNQIVFEASIFMLSKYFYSKMAEAQNRINVYELPRDNFSIKEKIIEIMEFFDSSDNYVKNINAVTFNEISKSSSSRDELFTYFLAVLEMAKLVLINLSQIRLFGDIYISPTAEGRLSYYSKIASMR